MNNINYLRKVNNLTSILIAISIICFAIFLFYIGSCFENEYISGSIKSFGTVFLSAGVIGFGYSIILKRGFLKEVQDSIDKQFYNRYNELKSFRESGIVSSYTSFPTESISANILASEKKVKILDTWIGYYMEIEKVLIPILRKGVAVEILLLNPESEQAIQRSYDIGRISPSYVKDQIILNLQSLSIIYDRLGKPQNLKIRTYDSTPVFTSYTSDKSTFIGFYWRKSNAEKGNYLEVNNLDFGFGQKTKLHFEDLWNSASENLNLDKYLKK